jgi:hypothetical protein
MLHRRSMTPADKKQILDRIYAAWITPRCELQRLGQLIDNAEAVRNQSSDPLHIFHTEDVELADMIEAFANG